MQRTNGDPACFLGELIRVELMSTQGQASIVGVNVDITGPPDTGEFFPTRVCLMQANHTGGGCCLTTPQKHFDWLILWLCVAARNTFRHPRDVTQRLFQAHASFPTPVSDIDL